MKNIKFNNYGLTNIFDLVEKYDGKQATESRVSDLKNDIFNSYANSPFMDFSTTGSNAHIVNIETLENCEILC